MHIRFQPTQFPHGDGVNSLELPHAEDETFLRGAVVTLDDGEVKELGAEDDILGVASHNAFASPSGEQVVYLAEGRQRFLGQAVDGADAVIEDVSTISVGAQYQVKAVDGVWFVDTDTTTDPHVVITQVIPEISCVVFRFLDAEIIQL